MWSPRFPVWARTFRSIRRSPIQRHRGTLDEYAAGRGARGLDFVVRGRGLATAPLTDAVVFERLHDDVGWPTYQAMFSPLATTLADTGAADTRFGGKVHSKQSVRLAEGSTVSSFISLLHPKGRGSVTLRSSDPAEQPIVEFPFLGGDGDVEDLTAACRRVREIYRSPAMRPFVLGESLPGPAVETDAEWEEFIRGVAHGAAHWAGTANRRRRRPSRSR